MRVVHVCRKPCSEGTVADNVLKHGCGALNIDACRVQAASMPKGCKAPGWDAYNKANAEQGYRPNDYKQGDAEYVPSPGGRWPANLILEHKEGCMCVGKRRVFAYSPGNKIIDGGASTGACYGEFSKRSLVRHADENGKEVVAIWDCAEGCPVAELDGQTVGLQPSKGMYRRKFGGTQFLGAFQDVNMEDPPTGVADSGGASRFFKQVQGE